MPNLLRGMNPLTRIAIILLITTPLLLSVDWVSAAVSLSITLIGAPLCGMGLTRLLKVSWPLFIIAPISGISMLLYARPSGEEYFSFWLATITDNSLQLALAMMLRVLAVALPVIVLARDIDPTELGDALSQILKLPSRFVIGAVAGVRMLTLFRDDWQAMAQSRRARGLADRGKIAHTISMSFGLLVLALRRGGKLATAMEARGFGSARKRTWARTSKLCRKDYVVMLISVVLAAIPVIIAVSTDSWRFFGL
ncbi:energy-coupling factor transporter transmembrane component T family protein [Corynebacterium sp. L4756]|uniref:energy-coupling factor transporter transmembrane component T family protein n=1 Tax=unclassified Corynebacterium TaxID=2624378 RepID=UPI00374DCA5A